MSSTCFCREIRNINVLNIENLEYSTSGNFLQETICKTTTTKKKQHGILYSAAQFIKILSYKILHVPESLESICISNIGPEN